MDPLKKIVGDRLRTEASSPHPDAEALSAFAENALPPTERRTVLAHLSSCADCRDILFLAAPPASEPQQVFVPKARRFFALRWGTLAACVVIGAAVLISRHEGARTSQALKGTTAEKGPASPAADSMNAMGKVPAEVGAIRDRQVAAKAAAPALVARGHAEAKAATAQPEAAMAFEDSGQVSLEPRKDADEKLESRSVQNLHVSGRNVAVLAQSSPAASPAVPRVAGGNAAGSVGGPVSANGSNEWLMKAVPKVNAPFHGSVFGVVSDASGAVVPNAKVTAIGPSGEKNTVSDQAGKFSLDQLAAGAYSIKANAPGFRETELKQVAVLADKPAALDLRLQPGSATESVTVEAAAAPVAQSPAANAIVARVNESSDAVQAAQARTRSAKETAELKKQKAASVREVSRADSYAPKPPILQWSLSSQGAVQRSSDNGRTWLPVAVADGVAFRAVASQASQVWAGGNAGVLYHSVDSGLTWTRVVPDANGEKLQADITQIQLPDPQHVSITTSSGQLWSTADGGQTWARK